MVAPALPFSAISATPSTWTNDAAFSNSAPPSSTVPHHHLHLDAATLSREAHHLRCRECATSSPWSSEKNFAVPNEDVRPARMLPSRDFVELTTAWPLRSPSVRHYVRRDLLTIWQVSWARLWPNRFDRSKPAEDQSRNARLQYKGFVRLRCVTQAGDPSGWARLAREYTEDSRREDVFRRDLQEDNRRSSFVQKQPQNLHYVNEEPSAARRSVIPRRTTPPATPRGKIPIRTRQIIKVDLKVLGGRSSPQELVPIQQISRH